MKHESENKTNCDTPVVPQETSIEPSEFFHGKLIDQKETSEQT